jgi:hypothetical protein
MSLHTIALPRLPSHYGNGPDLPVGTYHVVRLVDGRFSVERTIGAQRWFPITRRENPSWFTWPTLAAARDWMTANPDSTPETADQATCCEWLHWGRA